MQEVGGSSPPVPTSLRSRLPGMRLSYGWQADQRRLSAEAARVASDRVGGHREGRPGNTTHHLDCDSVSTVTVTLPDGSTRSVPRGTTIASFAGAELPAGVVRRALAATVDGRLVDLTAPLEQDATLRLVLPQGDEALALFRHSTAHLLAAAVTGLYPGTQCGIGPATDEGFFYDFVVSRPFVPEDLERIEARMRELAKADYVYERQMWPRDEALRFFADRGEPLKVQLIEEKTAGQSHVSCYTIKDRDLFVDFCVGPHVPSTGRLKGFKLLSTSNAYWKGDARNQPMQRVYGTAFFSDDELKKHLHQIEEAKRRDHRRVGKDLGLFTFHPWAPGTAFWLAKGTTLYNLLANYMREVLLPAGYVELKTPLIYNRALWETSGHWAHYRQNMFLVESEDVEMGVKAMNCPGHMLVFASDVRSYRDLPLRFHEQTPLHRNEASGVLSGLTRVRQFSQDDAHCFVMESQIGEEVARLLALVKRVYGDFGLEYIVKLATRPEEYVGERATWDHAEAQLRQALDASGMPYQVNEGDGDGKLAAVNSSIRARSSGNISPPTCSGSPVASPPVCSATFTPKLSTTGKP